MRHEVRSEFEVFLVEDVILTLGNLRGSLSWLGTSQSADPAIFRAGLDRLDQQIGMLEDRARALKRRMVVAAATDTASDGTMTPGQAGHPQVRIGQDSGTGGSYDGIATVPQDAPAAVAFVDLEVDPGLLAPFGSEADTGRGPAPEPAPGGASGERLPGPARDQSNHRSPADPDPVSLPLVDPAQPMPDDDGDDLNIFGSDPDLLPDPSWHSSPVPFRSRRSAP
jgi:hypothetical protein